MSHKFRLKKINETRNYLLQEIEKNELMSKKHKKICTNLKCIEHVLVLASTITRCIFNFCFCFFNWYSYRNYKFCNRIKCKN